MGLIATARRGTTASQDAPQRHAKGAARVEARDASQATGKRRKARVVISGAGTAQRPMPPTVARFAHRIAKAFSGASPDEPNT
jgi:hypothetical protein